MFEKNRKGSKLITCHLGNGCSVCAIESGNSVDTSMGFTPLSGLIMGTRSGDLDPSILFYLVEKEEMSLGDLHALLNRHSGLLGLSGYAADMRELLDEAEKGDKRCAQAIEAFCYRVREYIGAYMATLNGCDAIIFTGGIGENAAPIREKILDRMDYLGIRLDQSKNNDTGLSTDRAIHHKDSKTGIYIIPTNEELVIALDAAKIALGSTII